MEGAEVVPRLERHHCAVTEVVKPTILEAGPAKQVGLSVLRKHHACSVVALELGDGAGHLALTRVLQSRLSLRDPFGPDLTTFPRWSTRDVLNSNRRSAQTLLADRNRSVCCFAHAPSVASVPHCCPGRIIASPPGMKTSLQTWFSGRWSAGMGSAYWKALPMRSIARLLVPVFILSCGFGFAIDLLLLNYQPLARGFFWPVSSGMFSTVTTAARMKRLRRLVPVLILMTLVGLWLGVRISFHSPASPDMEALKRRVVLDASGILVGTILGYRLLVDFIRTEGVATLRMQTELALAHGIQATLVPTLSFQVGRFEAYGKSIPSTEMGGDLIDAVERDGRLLAYVADISGHGLAAGQLMGMLKTAIHVALQFRQEPVAVMESADRVLPAVKEANMYATLALLYFDGSSEAEYSLAGHPPILHYRAPTGDIARLAMEQFPLGLIPGGRYSSRRVSYSPRDLFLMMTDGISEVPNESDEEFGLDRLELLLRNNAGQPLPQLWELIMGDVTRHGLQQDDQTLLLLRVIT